MDTLKDPVSTSIIQQQDAHLINDRTWTNRCPYQHRLLNRQCVQNIYEFLDEINQIKKQALNKRHYNQIIPFMFYELNCFGQRLVSMSQRQLAIYNIPMKTQSFFNHPNLNDLNYSSFSVVGDKVVITGGNDFVQGEQPINPGQQVYLIELPKYSYHNKTKNYQQLPLKMVSGAEMKYSRIRHASVSDGIRYVYVLGSYQRSGANKFEIYDSWQDSWKEGPELIRGGYNLSCCYFKNGLKEESIWIYKDGFINTINLSTSPQEWKEYEMKGDLVNQLTQSHRQAMVQLNIDQILIFGGESTGKYNDIDDVYFLDVNNPVNGLSEGPKLPNKILPESPGYNLNEHVSFYFLGNIGEIYKFNKQTLKWSKLPFDIGSVF